MTAPELRRLRPRLLRWYRRTRRDLPWRRTRDPWAIWVSEVMLQQTQVATALPYWEAFLARFPTPARLARASEDEVLAAWSGLGYYRRARALRAAARLVTEQHGGRVPDDVERLRTLPGVGRYTAGAIASIAFGREAPVLDGNVRRVLCRLLAADGPDRLLWDAATTLVRGPAPGELNQALMELGALVCTPRQPHCADCPLAAACAARAAGSPEAYPAPTPRRPTERVRVAVACLVSGRGLLLERTGDESPLRGKLDLPAVAVRAGGRAETALKDALFRRYRVEVDVGPRVAAAMHGILHRRLQLELYVCEPGGRIDSRPDLEWIDPARIAEFPVSGATRKLLRHWSASSSQVSTSLGPNSEKRRPAINGSTPNARS
ncbi:MAG TPA: A/G-specific adenine glycosylase [Candidatus Polarisedimenticolaceae bacterium]|nr:A/G-specific adenine glycosylase [Candidatus Polarisedimenticolaceae bacterium]